MHILLTDLLTCPRCGPPFGLVLLARSLHDRRVLEGELGCPNCREKYPVTEGLGDLRAPPRAPLPDPGPAPEEPDPRETLRLAALLGVTSGPGHVVLAGAAAEHGPALTRLVAGIEFVAVSPEAVGWDETPGVSRIVARPGLPFHDRTLRGVALGPGDATDLLEEAIRTVAAGSRVVVLEAERGARERIESGGLSPVLEEGGVLVAIRK